MAHLKMIFAAMVVWRTFSLQNVLQTLLLIVLNPPTSSEGIFSPMIRSSSEIRMNIIGFSSTLKFSVKLSLLHC